MGTIFKGFKTILVVALAAFIFMPLNAELKPKERNILANEAKSIDLAKVMITDNSWNKLPGYRSRTFWDGLPAATRQEYITRAEGYLTYDWPVVPATYYLEYIRSGDRSGQGYSESALISLVMGELVEGKGRFLDQIINGVWYYCEQTWWGASAHLGAQKAGTGLPDVNDPIVDLGVGEVANNLSWTYYLFKEEFDKVHPLIAPRLLQEIYHKALTPYFVRDDFGYMGFKGGRPNNWNPWVNYNMLTSYLLLETDPVKKVAQVQKIINSLDKFLNGYSDDGGCDEGPNYWGGAGGLLYESLELLGKVTGGKFDVFDDPLIQNIGKYFYKVNIHSPYVLNFADADAISRNYGSIAYRYGRAIHDPIMQKFGAYLFQKIPRGEDGGRGGKIGDPIKNLVLVDELSKAEAQEALVSDFWFPDTEVAGARDAAGSFNGFFFGAKGGFNAESHNHNDIGNAVMYFDGKPCLIDIGRETYVAKTFSSRRYEIWTMQSGWHTVPVINGVEQKDGAQYKAKNSTFAANAKAATFSTDVAGSYLPDAKVKSWVRTYTLNRGKSFVISDKYELTEVKDAVTSSNIITYCKVTEVKPGLLKFEGDGFTLNMSYNTKVVKPVIEFKEVTDPSLKRFWPNGITRVKLEFIKPGLKGGQTVTFIKAV